MVCFSIVSDLKFRKFLGKFRTAFEEICPQLLRFQLFVDSSKKYDLKAGLLFVNFSKAESIADADYAYDIAFLTNSTTEAKSLLPGAR